LKRFQPLTMRKSTPIQSFFHNNPLPSNNIFGYGFIKIKTRNKILYLKNLVT